MNRYRLYFLNADGQLFRGQDCEAADDRAALEIAMALSRDHAIEIWQATRPVARLRRGGDAVPCGGAMQ
jgi:hypothetical protein